MPEANLEELLYSCMLVEPSRRTERLVELCTSHPELANALRTQFDKLVRMGLVTLVDGEVAPSAAPSTLPQTLGPFRIEGVLGRGGMGIVYRGTQPSVGDRPVAIKVLLPERVADAASEARFVREGLLAGRLQHPNLCPVLDVGKDQGVLYLAMPLVEGELLSARIERWRREGRSGDWRTIVGLVEKLARALHDAHARGLVHRDVKPANVIVRADGEPVLLDFGLARDVVDERDSLTRSVDVLGTPAYMAPEQADPRGRRADARTDVYALAATLFECLTLHLPHEAASRAELLRRIAGEPATPLRRHGHGLPRDLELVVTVALDADPARRYATAASFADDLARVQRGAAIVARPPGVVARTVRWAARNRAATALIAALTAGLSTTLALAAALDREGGRRQVGELVATARQHLAQDLWLPAFDAAEAAHLREPDAVRTQAPLYELFGRSRISAVFELPSDVNGFACSEDGAWLATRIGSDALVQSVDEPRRESLRLPGVKPRSLAWLSDGDVVARIGGDIRRFARDGATVWQRSIDDGVAVAERITLPAVITARVGALKVVVAGGMHGTVTVLDAASGEPLHAVPLALADGPVHELTMCPGADALLAGVEVAERCSAVFHVALDGSACIQLESRNNIVSKLLANERGCYASLSGGRQTFHFGCLAPQVLDDDAVARIRTATSRKISDFDLSRDVLVVAAGSAAVVLDFETSPEPLPIRHQGVVGSVAIAADGSSLLTASTDGLARRWDLSSGLLLETLAQAPASELTNIVARPGGRALVFGDDHRLLSIAAPPAPFVRTHVQSGQAKLSLSWTAQHGLLVATDGEPVLSLDPDTGRLLDEVRVVQNGAPDGGKTTARFVPGAMAAPLLWGQDSRQRGTFLIVDPRTGAIGAKVPLPKTAARAALGVAATRDGTACAMLRFSEQGEQSWSHVTVLRGDLAGAAWQVETEFEQHEPAARQLCWLDARRLLLACNDGSLRLVGEGLAWAGPGVMARSVAAAPDGRHVLAGYLDGSLFLVDSETGRAAPWAAHSAAVVACAFAPDGRLAATADASGELSLWDAAGVLRCRWRGHAQRVERLCFAPDGQRLATASRDGTVAIWPTDPAVVDRLPAQYRPQVVRLGAGR